MNLVSFVVDGLFCQDPVLAMRNEDDGQCGPVKWQRLWVTVEWKKIQDVF